MSLLKIWGFHILKRGETMSQRVILDEAAIQRTITRIAHEILEYNKGTDNLVLLGIKTRGAFLANRIQDKIHSIEQQVVPTGTIDITHFRDDIDNVSQQSDIKAFDIDIDITDKVVVIVDDVLYTGRTESFTRCYTLTFSAGQNWTCNTRRSRASRTTYSSRFCRKEYTNCTR